MTEETLKSLNSEGILDLLYLSTKELMQAIEAKDAMTLKLKIKQVQLLIRANEIRKYELTQMRLVRNNI